MEWFWLVAAVPALALALLIAESRGRRARIRFWMPAATSAGVRDLKPALSGTGWDLSGTFGTHIVRFGRNEGGRTRIQIEGASGITLRPQLNLAGSTLGQDPTEIQLGDEIFDKELYVYGTTEIVRALLDAATRGKVLSLVQGRIPLEGREGLALDGSARVVYGDLQVDLARRELKRASQELPALLRTLAGLAERLEPPLDVAGRIADNTRAEPEWRVRLANVIVLGNQYPRHPATRETLSFACNDGNDEVRLHAALGLGGERGRAVLIDIASQDTTGDSCAARAIAALPEFPCALAVERLVRARNAKRVETATACIEALGRAGGAKVVATLADVLAHDDVRLALPAAPALGACAAVEGEGPLVAALGRWPAELRTAVAEALGRIGTAAAVSSLREAEKGLFDVEFRRAVREAIASIQSRLGGAAPGQLSLAPDAAGRLSFAEDARGRVALADDGQAT